MQRLRSKQHRTNYHDAAKANVKIVVAKKSITTQLTKAVSLVDRLKAKEENIQELKRAANAEREKRMSLEQELARQLKK